MKKFLSALLVTALLTISAVSLSGCTDITKSSNYNSYELKYLVNLTAIEDSEIANTVNAVQKSLDQRLHKFEVAKVEIDITEEEGSHYIIMKFGTIDVIKEIKKALTLNNELILNKRFEDESDYETELKLHAETDLKDLLENNADFDLVAQNSVLSDPERIVYAEADEWMYKEEILVAFSEIVFEMEIGEVHEEIIEFEIQPSPLSPPITVYSIARLFDKRENHFVKVSHILIPYEGAESSPADETQTKKEAEILANELLVKLNEGENFATLAKEYSSCPSLENGGILDTPAGTGFYVPEFEVASLALTEVGEITETVETKFGYHIIQADEIIPMNQVKFGVIFYAPRPAEWESLDFTSEYTQSVNVKYDDTYDPYIVIQFNSEGKEKLKEITENNMDSIIGVFSGMTLVTSFTVKEINEDGIIKILSPTNTIEAEALKNQLENGKLAAPIILKDEQFIKPLKSTEE